MKKLDKRTTAKLPVIVNRKGGKRVIEVRRASNEEIMQDSLNRRGVIRLRVTVQIGNGRGDYVGFQGASSYKEVSSIKKAREFESKLRDFVKGDW